MRNAEKKMAAGRPYTPVTAARTTLPPADAVKLDASLSSGIPSATPSVRIATTWVSATEMSPVGLPGVPPAEMPRLGERTFRTDEARQRDPSGSGLGLAITSEICKRCGWKLAFEPHEPRGLRVSIAGPAGPAPKTP